MFFFKLIMVGILVAIPLLSSGMSFDQEWLNLLHYESDGTPEVKNTEFYLSNSQRPGDESNEFLRLYNLEERASSKVHCYFPARYYLLEKYGKIRRKGGFQGCTELNKFLKETPGDHVSLAITSEYLNAPSSAFGHLMLVIHENKIPSLTDSVVHYSAETKREDGLFAYALKGLTGSYPGYYFKEKLFSKIHEYGHVEQRYLFYAKLDLTAEQIYFLKLHLFELTRARFDYYFLNKNCGYRIDRLLSLLYGKKVTNNFLYTLPVEIPYKFQSHFLTETKVIPYSVKAKESIRHLSPDERKTFKDIIASKQNLKESDSRRVKSSVFHYYQYKFRKDGIGLPNYSSNLRASTFVMSEDFDTVQAPYKKQRPFKIALGMQKKKTNEAALLSFQPALLDLKSPQKYNLHESKLSLLNFSLLYSEKNLRLNRLDILDTLLFTEYSEFFNSLSWKIYLGVDRENHSQDLAQKTEIGMGHSVRFYALFNYFVTAGYTFSSEEFIPYVAPELNLIYYFSSHLKLGSNFKYKISKYATSWRSTNFLSYLLRKDHEVIFEFEKELNDAELFKLKYRYFF